MRKPVLRNSLLLAIGAASAAMLLVSRDGRAQSSGGQQTLGPQDVILRAMRDEIQRSRQLSVVDGQDPPYFFSYDLTDAEDLRVSASMGSAITVARNHARIPGIEVRVGDYKFDNTGFAGGGFYRGSRYDGSWPLDDDYANLRESFWLGTDHEYKAALDAMGRKRAALKNAAASAEQLPDFSKTDPVVSLPKVSHRKIDDAAWASKMARLSGVFNPYPDVLTSGVELEMIDGITYQADSEGTEIRYADSVNYIMARAEGQAPDGMYVRDSVSIPSLDPDKLPPEADLRKTMTGLAEDVRALVKAPVGESYTGPALFEPEAAAQLLAQLLGDNLCVTQKPLTAPGGNASYIHSEFESRIGARVLPEWMDVTDDPTQTAWNGNPLLGWYPFDLEGVPPKAVQVIQKGILKSFLTTRQPLKGFPVSNGHARLQGSYGAHDAAISNLFVTASQSMPMADLKQRLIQMTKDQGKSYGMLIRKLDFPYSAGTGELRRLAQASAQSGGSARPVSPPLLVYRVYPDGREELVRGLRFRGLSTRDLRDIQAATKETALFNFVNNNAPLALMGAGGLLAPASVVSPGLLFDEIEFELPQDQLPTRAIVPPPNG